jgi:hypothetical protein
MNNLLVHLFIFALLGIKTQGLTHGRESTLPPSYTCSSPKHMNILFFIFILAVLEIELKASHLLDKGCYF